jgi:membrane protein
MPPWIARFAGGRAAAKIDPVAVGDLSARIDTLQRRHAWIAFPLAVRQKYADDRGGTVAAAVTYYAFFSLFPLLIVATTVLGFVVHGDAAAQERLAHSVLGRNPLLEHDLRVHALTGSTTALVVGLVTTLWAGMRVFTVSESAARWIWYQAEPRLAGTLRTWLRALQLLAVVGGGALVTIFLAGARSAAGASASAALLVVSLAADFGLFWLASRLLSPRDVRWRQLVPGAAVGAAGWAILQEGGNVIFSRILASASATYGTFAAVIALLSLIYLAVSVALVAMEINVVAVRGLWPRSFAPLDAQARTSGDDRAAALRIDAIAPQSMGAEFPQQVGALADSRTAPAGRELQPSNPDGGSTMDSLLQEAGQMAGSELKRMRWALGLSGALSLAFGIAIIVWPNISLFSLVIVFGIFAFARGVMGLFTAFASPIKDGRGWLIVSSLAGIAVGLLCFFWTGMSALALLLVIGAYAVVLGIIAVGGAFWLPLDGGDRALLAVTGFVSILFGIVMFASPNDGAIVLLSLIAAYAIIVGVMELVVAIGGKRLFERELKQYVTGPRTRATAQASR